MAFLRRFWQRDAGQQLAACTALDVGTEFAKALVFEIDAQGHGTVRGVGRKRQGLAHMQSGTVADIAAVVDNCAVALQEAEEMAGFRPTQVVIGIAGELVKGFTTTHSQERKQAGRADHRGRAAEAHRRRAARGAASRPSGRSPGRPACRNVDVRLVHAAVTSRQHRRLPGDEPGRLPGPPRPDQRSSTRSPRWSTWARCRAWPPSSTWSCWRSSPSRTPWPACSPREQVQQAGALFVDIGGGTTDVALVRAGRDRGDAHVRPRRPGLHQVAGRSPGPAVPAGRGAQGRLRARAGARASATRSREIVGEDVAVWAAGVELVLDELAGRRPAARADLPVRRRLAPAGDRRPRCAIRSSGSACRSAGRPRSWSWSRRWWSRITRRHACCWWTSRT